MTLGTLVGCSNEDSAPLTATPLEGDWLLVFQFGGDPAPEDEFPGDISDQNIRYHFNGNINRITENGNPVDGELNFALVEKEGFYEIIYNQYPDFPYRVYFSDNNTTATFQAMPVDSYLVLRKIQ